MSGNVKYEYSRTEVLGGRCYRQSNSGSMGNLGHFLPSMQRATLPKFSQIVGSSA